MNVRYLHERHGNSGKQSNLAKPDVKGDLLAFVDANSAPNGRSKDSFGQTLYFSPKFSTVQVPKPIMTTIFPGQLLENLQQEKGKAGCSNGFSLNGYKERDQSML